MPRADYGLGWVPSRTRSNDMAFLMSRRLPTAAERMTDPPPAKKSHDLPARYLRFQGGTSTCTEHGIYHLVVAAPFKTRAQSRLWPQFSAYREYILNDEWTENDHEAAGPDSGLNFGSSTRAAMDWLVKKGYAKGYAWAFNRAPASLWVRTVGPVVAGTVWYSSMFQLTREGFAKITPNATVEGGHLYCWVGADERRGVDLWANSWVRWGIDRRAFNSPGKYEIGTTPPERQGFFMTAAETTERLIHENGDIATATEQRWKPSVS